MARTKSALLCGLAFLPAVALALGVAPLAAQQPPQEQTPPPQAAPEAELVFEREIFRYPGFQRRNPFRPLLGDDAGPRFEQIELRAIAYDADPRRSLALVALRRAAEQQAEQQLQQQMQQQETGTGPQRDTLIVPELTQRLRVGESWGNVRVLEIRQDHLVLAVTEFGVTEQRILRMPVRRQGGP